MIAFECVYFCMKKYAKSYVYIMKLQIVFLQFVEFLQSRDLYLLKNSAENIFELSKESTDN